MNLSVSHPLDSRSPFGTFVPPPPAGGVFPGRGALGKEVSFSMKLICVCWKTSRNAKASPTRGGGIERSEDVGEVVQSSTCVLRSLERRPLSNLSDACGASSPGRGALGKEVSFSMKPICVCWKTSRNAKASPTRGAGIERSEDVGEVSSPQKQIPHTGRLRCGGAGMESGNVFNRFCHRRQRCGSCHRRCRCTAPDRGRCAPRPPHRWGRGLQWQKPCSGSRCRPCR